MRPCQDDHPDPQITQTTCRICHLYLHDATYRDFWDKPSVETQSLNVYSPCRYLAEPLLGYERELLGLDHRKEWKHCEHPVQPLGPVVCSCAGCGVTCPGYETTPSEIDCIGKRHLLFHVMPVSYNGTWQRCLAQLLQRIDQFDGRRLIGVITRTEGTQQQLDSIELVSDFVGDRCEIIPIPNDPSLREVVTWLRLWPMLEANPSDVVFWGHAKGVTRPFNPGVSVHTWTRILFETLLEFPDKVGSLLQLYPIVGTFLKIGNGFHPSQSKFHYSGGMFWLRFREAQHYWQTIDRHWWGTESWPGLHYPVEQAGCIFKRGTVPHLNLYDPTYLTTVLEEYQIWKKQQRFQ